MHIWWFSFVKMPPIMMKREELVTIQVSVWYLRAGHTSKPLRLTANSSSFENFLSKVEIQRENTSHQEAGVSSKLPGSRNQGWDWTGQLWNICQSHRSTRNNRERHFHRKPNQSTNSLQKTLLWKQFRFILGWACKSISATKTIWSQYEDTPKRGGVLFGSAPPSWSSVCFGAPLTSPANTDTRLSALPSTLPDQEVP